MCACTKSVAQLSTTQKLSPPHITGLHAHRNSVNTMCASHKAACFSMAWEHMLNTMCLCNNAACFSVCLRENHAEYHTSISQSWVHFCPARCSSHLLFSSHAALPPGCTPGGCAGQPCQRGQPYVTSLTCLRHTNLLQGSKLGCGESRVCVLDVMMWLRCQFQETCAFRYASQAS
jgi:hypothetical protein